MNSTRTFSKAFRLTFAALILLSVAEFAVRQMLALDLGQIVTLILYVYPLIALLYGIACALVGLNWWLPLVLSALLFAVNILVRYNATGLVYVAPYTLITGLGYALAFYLKRTFARKPDSAA